MMGEAKDLTDQIYEDLMDRLEEEGYSIISTTANNKIVDIIDAGSSVDDLLPRAIEIIKEN
jgi:hypothetical protein